MRPKLLTFFTFLLAVYFRDNHDRVNNFDIGITWRFNIYKR